MIRVGAYSPRGRGSYSMEVIADLTL